MRMKNFALILAVTGLAVGAQAASIDVNTDAALEGTYGLEVIMDGVADGAYVVDTTPTNETTYRARFLIDLLPGDVDEFSFEYGFPQPTPSLRQRAYHMIFSTKDLDQPGGPARQHVSVLLKKFEDGTPYGRYKVWARVYDPDHAKAAVDGYVYSTSANEALEVNLPKSAAGFPVIVQIEFQSESSDGAGDGIFSLTRATNFDPNLFEGKTMTDLTNFDKNMDQVELGAPSGVDDGSAGSYYIDSFESYRTLAP
jgi:hypothetical protein